MTVKDIFKLMCALCAAAVLHACEDDLLYEPDGVEPGRPTVAAITVRFDADDSVELRSRALGAEAGDALQDINSFYMLMYDTDGCLKKRYHIMEGGKVVDDPSGEVLNAKYRRADNRLPSEGDLQDNSSGMLTFDLHTTSDRYFIYGVANVPEVASLPVGSHRDELKRMRRLWDETSLMANSEMFGVFSIGANRGADDATAIGLRADGAQLHCWLRRLASKVTVAFDGRELYDNVQVYIDTIMLCDVPRQCYLGENNYPGRELDDLETWAAPADRYKVDNGVLPVGALHSVQALSETDLRLIAPENYYHVCNTSHPYMGSDQPANDPEILSHKHSATAPALYFYENLQGTGKRKAQSSDGATIDWPRPVPEDTTSGWKDNKAYGTYVEVRGFYRCTSVDGSMSSGWIKYRFMLGQDTECDYDAFRNTHYKLTLKLRGYGNDYDWHIDYKERTGIFVTTPQYISYLYNKSMYATVKIVGRIKPGTKVRAEIVDDRSEKDRWERTHWRPWGNNSEAFPDPDEAKLPGTNRKIYYTGADLNSLSDGPATSFLSLRYGNVLRIEKPGWEGASSYQISVPEALQYAKQYYEDNKEGERDYAIEENDPDMNDTHAGVYTMQVTRRDPTDNTILERLYRIPLFTRAKELVTRTGFTGNNPYTAYPRKEKVRFTATIWNDETQAWEDNSVILDVVQVRRVVNPKGIWRRGSNVKDFHVRLLRLPSDGASEFVSFSSTGKWSAEVMRASDPIISLSSTPAGTGPDAVQQSHMSRIEGESECPVDFDVNFNGGKGFAVIRVRYHNYTCEHDIFVRVGYDDVELVPGSGVKWSTCNVHHFEGNEAVLATSPLQEGSLFRRGSGTAILAKNSKVNAVDANSGNRGFAVIKPDSRSETTATWADCQATAAEMADPVKPFNLPSDESANHDWGISNPGMRIASIDDFYTITSVTNDPEFKYKKAYGVLYGDGAETVAYSLNDAYGYDSETGDDSPKGMRGVFVYNSDNYHMIFLPIGMSGYGRRKGNGGWTPSPADPVGTQRYASRSQYSAAIAKDQPLFYDLYRRSGAIYWCKYYQYPIQKRTVSIPNADGGVDERSVNDVTKSSAFDINYFTMGFEGFENGSVVSDGYHYQRDGSRSDACFIRTVSVK